MSATRQRGLALIAVLWGIALLTIMAGSFSLSMQRDAGLARNAQERARGLALADAGVHYAMLMLTLPDPLRRWRGDGGLYEVRLPDGFAAIRVFDESGKIDINAAQQPTLLALLGHVLIDPERAEALADAIMDWRDNDELKRLHGAEAKDYQAENKPYVPPNKPFQVLEELQMVLGMTPALYARLEPLLTIYSNQDGLNPQKASREMLLSLPGLDAGLVDAYVQSRAQSPNNALAPLPAPINGIRTVGGGDAAYTVFVEAHASEEEGPATRLQVVMRRQASRGAPFAIAAWKPGRGGALRAQPLPAAPSPFLSR
jgi:general secretion pathway protein K